MSPRTNTASTRWDDFSLQFVSLKVPKERNAAGPAALRLFIERQLSSRGRPVRWAVVEAGPDELTVDAVVSFTPSEEGGAPLYTDDSEGRLLESNAS